MVGSERLRLASWRAATGISREWSPLPLLRHRQRWRLNITRRWDGSRVEKWMPNLKRRSKNAIAALLRQRVSASNPETNMSALGHWFGIGEDEHAFDQACNFEWLSLRETQIMAGVAYHALAAGEEGTTSLYAALTGKRLPCASRAIVQCEVPTSNGGNRIDLIFIAECVNRGVIVEAKFGSSLQDNPLKDYGAFCEAKWPAVFWSKVVLDFGPCRGTDRVLSENPDWKLVSWRLFTARLERQVARDLSDTEQFRFFRRMLWKNL